MNSPDRIHFIDERLDRLAQRMSEAIVEIGTAHQGEEVALVSHSDPIKAAVLELTSQDLAKLHALSIPTGGIVTLDVSGNTARMVEI